MVLTNIPETENTIPPQITEEIPSSQSAEASLQAFEKLRESLLNQAHQYINTYIPNLEDHPQEYSDVLQLLYFSYLRTVSWTELNDLYSTGTMPDLDSEETEILSKFSITNMWEGLHMLETVIREYLESRELLSVPQEHFEKATQTEETQVQTLNEDGTDEQMQEQQVRINSTEENAEVQLTDKGDTDKIMDDVPTENKSTST